MYEHEGGRNPVLGAPGSNNFAGLIASSTNQTIGTKGSNHQGLSEKEAEALCREYKPLVLSEASKQRGKGIEFDELLAAGQLGLARALKKFNPGSGSFGAYARYWIHGEITALFKSTADIFSLKRKSLTILDDNESKSHQRDVADESAPAIVLDLSALSEEDRHIVEARNRAETLSAIGKALGLSAERIRQREERARSQIKGNIASQCVSDLTQRGKVIKFPEERRRRLAEFPDRPPPKHVYREPQPSKQLARHRRNAGPLAELRGNSPLRNPNGPYGGPVIHDWGLPLNTAERRKPVRLDESGRRRLLPRSTKFEIDWYGGNRCRKAVPFDDMAGLECIVPKQPIGGFTILTEQGWRNLVDHQWGRK
jgi:RNA polymerase sigma factor (sigma-70 family)